MSTKIKTEKMLGVKFTSCSYEDVLANMENGIVSGHRGYISITNTESLYHAVRKPEHFQYINHADFSCCDGVAVVLAGRLLGIRIARLHGPDLMLRCCEYGASKGWRHYFYGGKKGVSQALSEKLTRRSPGMITAGMLSPPFRALTPSEDKNVIDQINSVNPDILWVGLGLIKQEQWISEHLSSIKVPWMIGVGAAFDFHAGTVKRAPKYFRKIGMEWLYRLAFEPRMLIRNLYSLAIFLPVLKKVLKRDN